MRRQSRFKKIAPFTAASVVWALSIGTSFGAPSDAAGTAPVNVASSTPKSGAENDLVSSSGEAAYRIAFDVPPGRNGAAPKIALEYGSRSPIRGGVAAGWTLPLSKIHLDTTVGRAGSPTYAVDGARLIQSNDPPSTATGVTYRAHGDASYTIYEHVDDGTLPGTWLARHNDGSITEYGKGPSARDQLDPRDTGAQYGTQGRWFVSRTVDARGNEVLYAYVTVNGSAHGGTLNLTPVDIAISSIQYGRNVNAAGSVHVAKIDFVYNSQLETCAPSAVPIGAQFDFRTGIRRYLGAAKLLSIRASVLTSAPNAPAPIWALRRELDLTYDAAKAACGQPHAPMRVLASVQLTAWDDQGNALSMPPTTFGYGPLDYDFANTGQLSDGDFGKGGTAVAPGGAVSFPTSLETTADIDGNGTLDHLNPSQLASGGCVEGGVSIPGLPWNTPGSSTQLQLCAADLQIGYRPNAQGAYQGCPANTLQDGNHERFLDINGDGLPDLVTQLSYQGLNYDPSTDSGLEAVLNPGHAVNDYPDCSTMPVQPCLTSNGAPSPCLLDVNQGVAGWYWGPDRWSATGAVPVSYTNQDTGCTPIPDMRCGYYVLRYYQNLGNGAFAQTPQMIYSPVPLETMAHSSRYDNGALATASEAHAMLDLDGDGQLDAVYYQLHGITGGRQYSVFRGDGAGHFPQRLDWPVQIDGIERHAPHPYYTGNAMYDETDSINTLRDINGDGLPDLVSSDPTYGLSVHFNTGNGFEPIGTTLETQPLSPLYSTSSTIAVVAAKDPASGLTTNGYTVAMRRPVDLDGDGLTDVAVLPGPAAGQLTPNGTPAVTVYVNLGDMLVPVALTSAQAALWYPSLLNMNVYQTGYPYAWRVATDVVDADGDGLPEVQQLSAAGGQCSIPYFDGCGVQAQIWEAKDQPYRLLTTVDNGFGVTTTYSYASVRDTTVVTGAQDAVHRIQSPLRVVKRIDVASTTAPTASTSYVYTNPVTAADAFGRVGFRGFEQITETGPAAESGAQLTSIRKIDFSVDPSGRTRETLSLDSGTLVRVSQTDWKEARVGAASVRSYLPSETRKYVCTPRVEALAAAENDCIVTDAKLERHLETWTPILPADALTTAPLTGVVAPPPGSVIFLALQGGPYPIAYAKTFDARTGVLGATQVGDRGDSTSYEVHSTGGNWLVLPKETKTLAATAANDFTGAVLLAHAITTYDAGLHGLPVSVQRETTPGVFATSTSGYDAYGNVTSTMRPNQVARGASGLSAQTIYDAYGMYPIADIDELSHRVEHDWDIALGKAIEVRGPQQGTVMPHEHTTYDAFGRVLKETRFKNVGNSPPADIVVYQASYSDTLASHSVATSSLLDYSSGGAPATPLGAGGWRQVKTTLDGFGRSVQEQRYTSQTTWETTSRRYDAAGNLVEVDVPNPGGASPASVAYTTSFDGLGRPTRENAPARAPRTTTYTGIYVVTNELPTDDTVAYAKTMGYDAFGRLISVSEGATTRSVTGYAYDALDRVRQITDADGQVTVLAYELSGHRSSVTRAGSQLAYSYDPDGNRSVVFHPRPAGVLATDPAWQSTFSYDALDRPILAVPATRDLTAADQARLKVGSTSYTYDETARKYGIGRLTTVTYQFGTVSYDYSIEGWVAKETRNLSVAPDGVTLTASGSMQTTAYTPFGTPQIVWYGDDPTYATSARFVVDLQGRPNRADIGQNGNGFQAGIAVLNRNAAGLVATRTATGNANVEQSFTYDTAGRVADTSINGLLTSGGASATLAGEAFVYQQGGNAKQWTDHAKNRVIAMTYDDRQELKTAIAGTPSDYSGTFAYGPSGKITSANVQSTLAGAQVTSRSVSYDFTAGNGASFPRPDLADPAAVRRLVNGNGTAFASFAYDESSNLRSKVVGGATSTFLYDGTDQLREARTATSDEIYYYDQSGERILVYKAAASGQPATLRHRFGTAEVTTDTTGARTSVADVVLGGHPVARVKNHDVTSIQTLYHGVLGNLLAVLDKTKVLRARYGYGPYGEILFAEGPDAGTFDHTYEDKARDASTGLSYFGRRYFDPLTLTWTQADPLYREVPDLASVAPRKGALFTYALANPLGNLDPDGLDSDSTVKDTTQKDAKKEDEKRIDGAQKDENRKQDESINTRLKRQQLRKMEALQHLAESVLTAARGLVSAGAVLRTGSGARKKIEAAGEAGIQASDAIEIDYGTGFTTGRRVREFGD